MSFNKILAKKVLGYVSTSSGKSLVLSAVTKTSLWFRPDGAADAVKTLLEAAVAANESAIPGNMAEVIAREGDHTSDADSRSYITAVCVNDSGNFIRTVHPPTGK
ncbi:hypothetical protein B0T25DRAFT_458895 [Lasiosphaeria hispida]|uniref:Uncharacterized protein n=1 Tax=Lasiosphaeria hispida TaxID=260671 RepID=A0AAJ0HFF1_9PEZI|nr:hypothetical protein B0T25DRAFT_458895 [Lasiosphaeria hispida]